MDRPAIIRLSSAIAGYSISPDEAKRLEALLSADEQDLIARWKLLGYYHTHQRCCHHLHRQNAEHIKWVLRNDGIYERVVIHFLTPYNPCAEAIQNDVMNSWRERVALKGNDIHELRFLADAMQRVDAKGSLSVWEQLVALDPRFAKHYQAAKELANFPVNPVADKYTCHWDVINSVDGLLEQTREAVPHSDKDFAAFEVLVRAAVDDPSFCVYLMFSQWVPENAPPEILCRAGLSDMYGHYAAKSEEGKILRRKGIKTLWKHLVTLPESWQKAK